jgi:hypothetical protein
MTIAKIRSGLIRIPIIINFAILILLVSPIGQSRSFYSAVKQSGYAGLLTTGLPLWMIATTLLVTVMFFCKIPSRSPAKATEQQWPMRLDGTLLLAWWVALVFSCMYAFMIGMGGG